MEACRKVIEYNFICKHCGSLITAENDDLHVVDIGVVGYDCPICKKRRAIRMKELNRKIIYVKERDPK